MSLGLELLNDKAYMKICYNIANPKHLYKDLYQEVVLTIISKEFNLYEIKNRMALSFFFSAFAYKTFHSNKFCKQYGLKNEKLPIIDDILTVIDEPYDTTLDEKIDKIVYETKRQKETEREKYLDLLFKRYLECNESGYIVSSTYNIPARTVYAGLKEYKEQYRKIYEAACKV